MTKTTNKRQLDNTKARALAGAAALTEMLHMIGKDGITDHDMAQVLADYELDLRGMLDFFWQRVPL